jgi:DNA mismatch endonuclease, patch repair protein
MARIRGSDTTPEMRLRRHLWADGFRYRLQYKTPGGKPDLTFPGPQVAVFVDGCFWHGCPDHYVRPRSRSGFWSRKLRENVARDRRQTAALEAEGWTVCRFWEHEVWVDLDGVIETIRSAISREDHPTLTPRWHVVEVVPLDSTGDRERRVMEALREPALTRYVERDRSTEKW